MLWRLGSEPSPPLSEAHYFQLALVSQSSRRVQGDVGELAHSVSAARRQGLLLSPRLQLQMLLVFVTCLTGFKHLSQHAISIVGQDRDHHPLKRHCGTGDVDDHRGSGRGPEDSRAGVQFRSRFSFRLGVVSECCDL